MSVVLLNEDKTYLEVFPHEGEFHIAQVRVRTRLNADDIDFEVHLDSFYRLYVKSVHMDLAHLPEVITAALTLLARYTGKIIKEMERYRAKV